MAIMAHPRRAPFVEELQAQLPEATVVWDQHDDRWETGRRALLAYQPDAEAHAVIQDDAIPCADFIAGLERITDAAQGHPIGLYIGSVRPHQNTVTPALRRAIHEGSPWLVAPGPYWGVGLVLPVADIDELVAWGDKKPEIKNYDRRIARFYETQGRDCWYTVPSLVDHRPVHENPSLVTGRVADRRAHSFLKGSPLDVDWTQPPTHLAESVVYRHKQTDERRRVVVGSQRQRRLQGSPRWEAFREEVPHG